MFGVSLDVQQYPRQVEWFAVGAVVSLLLGFLSLMVVAVGEAQERSSRMRAMRMLAASRRDLFTAHFWCVAVPITLMGLGAVGVGWLVAQAMRNIDDRAHIQPQLYGLLTLLVILAAGAVTILTWRSVTRPADRSGSFAG